MNLEGAPQESTPESHKIIRFSKDPTKHGVSFGEGEEQNSITYINQEGEKFGETNVEKVFAEAKQHIDVILRNIENARKMYEAVVASGETVDIKKELIEWIDGDIEKAFFELRHRTTDMVTSMSNQLKAKGMGVAVDGEGKRVLTDLNHNPIKK
ncbi:MAG: hypothetical protein KBD16_04615 [Candidatus Pacebacteria bacterium]|nr:hypothetical protein [Candidatus Paceibacterota bacterium]